MTLDQKVRLVEALFDQLERETQQFQDKSGLGCVSGCGKCCSYPNIDASPLEFLPWAFQLFLSGKAEDALATLQENTPKTCFLLTPVSILSKGHCGSYKHRGLICRLFGYAASRDKHGNLRLATCKTIKEEQADSYRIASEAISKGTYVPVFTDYYMQLNQIDYQMESKIMPINKALKMALEEVLQYYTYRPVPTLDRQIG
ncbi:YkgJ family cysteine cluster protein [Muricauda sp. 334s03]|uniref:YkgJ family cysteine cluster protein n=1 Tax=Flagellimonas yonaguniensis TaxID=3031325 RepID=A0ABT5Y0E5_9FLAO|nr:YkgJ family cysteine cluster protein [[Muricauda] yonaguniensis]MDF0716833.1 YkgJ family cysteine cluster protein [[Muricauda] yonaguniensis]